VGDRRRLRRPVDQPDLRSIIGPGPSAPIRPSLLEMTQYRDTATDDILDDEQIHDEYIVAAGNLDDREAVIFGEWVEAMAAEAGRRCSTNMADNEGVGWWRHYAPQGAGR
jgi:hypothetical protein